MSLVIAIALILGILVLAVGVIAMVAYTSRDSALRLNNEHMQQALEEANRLLNAQGEPPKFLQRLDERDDADEGDEPKTDS